MKNAIQSKSKRWFAPTPTYRSVSNSSGTDTSFLETHNTTQDTTSPSYTHTTPTNKPKQTKQKRCIVHVVTTPASSSSSFTVQKPKRENHEQKHTHKTHAHKDAQTPNFATVTHTPNPYTYCTLSHSTHIKESQIKN